jgi:hypothetical protein
MDANGLRVLHIDKTEFRSLDVFHLIALHTFSVFQFLRLYIISQIQSSASPPSSGTFSRGSARIVAFLIALDIVGRWIISVSNCSGRFVLGRLIQIASLDMLVPDN